MSQNNESNGVEVLFTESPASWNTRYQTKEGFVCQLTIRADKGKELLELTNAALKFLKEKGCTPYYYGNNSYNPADINNEKNGKETRFPEHHFDNSWCHIHQCRMKRRQKNGKVWFSHQVIGVWCNGKEA